MLLDIVKKITIELTSRAVDNRVADYRENFFRYQEMAVQVNLELDKSLMTFSIAGLAALAALNERVFVPYGMLSYATFATFLVVVTTVIAGYFVSRSMIKDAQRILTENYTSSLTAPLNRGLEQVKFRRFSILLNIVSSMAFIAAVCLFLILMALYIKGVGE